MRNAATHNGKDLAREIALLKQQLDDLADTVNGTGSSIVARGEEALEETLKSARELVAKYGDTAKSIAHDTAKLRDKATDTLIEQTETRPLTTLAAIIGVGFPQAGFVVGTRRPLQAIPAGPPSMIGPLLRVAASAAAARSCAMPRMMWRRAPCWPWALRLRSVSAWSASPARPISCSRAISTPQRPGASWLRSGLAGLIYFAVASRRRG